MQVLSMNCAGLKLAPVALGPCIIMRLTLESAAAVEASRLAVPMQASVTAAAAAVVGRLFA